MAKKLFLQELDCYKQANEQIKSHKLYCPKRSFDLSKLGDKQLAIQMDSFIRDRGKQLATLSIRSELNSFNQLCNFVNQSCPELYSFEDISEDELVKKAKEWLLKNKKKRSQKRKKTDTGKIQITEPDLIKYIRKIYRYLYPSDTRFIYEHDRWYLKDIPIDIRKNPTITVKSISFEKIIQPNIREEIKSVIIIHLSDVALGTVLAEITAINRFSRFLSERYPEVVSLNDINRDIFEKYLIHTHTEATGRKSYSKELCHLRSIFITAGKVLENKELEKIFYKDDIGKVPAKLYKVYSDEELKRLNSKIVEGDEQIARVLFLHQLLGTRISDTLTLRQDAIFTGDDGKPFIRIRQVKTGKTYEKAINEEICQLFNKACEYTRERFGNREYVFINEAEPDKPMQYGRIKYHIMAMVQKNDLRDDNGELFGVGTHIWRHCYGKRLTELHIDDITISKLMGHSNTSSLKYYRKIGNQMLADETREMRASMDEMLKEIIAEW